MIFSKEKVLFCVHKLLIHFPVLITNQKHKKIVHEKKVPFFERAKRKCCFFSAIFEFHDKKEKSKKVRHSSDRSINTFSSPLYIFDDFSKIALENNRCRTARNVKC